MASKRLLKGQDSPEVLKRRVGIALIILFVALILFSGYFLFYYPKLCEDTTGECFVDAMDNCKSVSWIKEDEQASWVYAIKGGGVNGACKVEVKLLKMKQGTIDSEKLQGKAMICNVLKGETRFPEKDISRCSGELKEELQDLIIQRMHNYLLENVGMIGEEFQGL
jgi:hypothetical protein